MSTKDDGGYSDETDITSLAPDIDVDEVSNAQHIHNDVMNSLQMFQHICSIRLM